MSTPSDMATPAALFAFHMRVPQNVRSVELFGSWDNFANPYRLHRDRLRGRGAWAGCYTFKDIVFDGDCPRWTTPRNGGLKQGGRYWYFYRLDDADELCDPSQPITKDCPLLPGQKLNLLDVPVEVLPTAPRSFSAPLKTTPPLMTLDPNDRYRTPEQQSSNKDKPHPPLPSNDDKENDRQSPALEQAPVSMESRFTSVPAKSGHLRPFTSVSLFAADSRPPTSPRTDSSSCMTRQMRLSIISARPKSAHGSAAYPSPTLSPWTPHIDTEVESPTLTADTLSTPDVPTPDPGTALFKFDFQQPRQIESDHTICPDDEDEGKIPHNASYTTITPSTSGDSYVVDCPQPLKLDAFGLTYAHAILPPTPPSKSTSGKSTTTIHHKPGSYDLSVPRSVDTAKQMPTLPVIQTTVNIFDDFDFLGQAIL